MFLVLMKALQASVGIPGVHYHRYMLSDYRPQHNNRTQKDYLPLRRPVYPEMNDALVALRNGSLEPVVKLEDSDTQTPLFELLVRIYSDNKYVCMGTLITESLIMTSATCFNQMNAPNLTIKTSTNLILGQLEIVSDNSVVKTLSLRKPVPHMNFTAQLCDSVLHSSNILTLPTYIRSRRVVHTQTANVIPLNECRNQLDDPDGNIVTDSMICIRNEKRTSTCQKSHGTPLIYKGQICGVNILGHNCPKYYGVDLYASVLNEVKYFNATLKKIKASKIEDFL
ncbi:seminase-like [Drosophila innubila]|uniref:seminase-like n=1 Tax=Drosophila innubila TaxID=198719 RepID=UPI00148DE1F0|nr:seminase-like [Drosophila innubila]